MSRFSSGTSVFAGQKRHRVNLRTFKSGGDLVVIVEGGDVPHIGAIAVGVPRPSLKNPDRTSSTVSVFALTGHKDEIIARYVSEKMASSLNQIVVVVAGVHVNEATEQDIEKLVSNSMKCVEVVLKKLKERT